jgi:hypothetical protein
MQELSVNKQWIKDVLFTKKQYIVPFFQRRYVWGKENFQALISNVESLERKEIKDHFLGAVFLGSSRIFVQNSFTKRNPDIEKCIIVDGQQRLTTISIFLAAIRDRIRKLKFNNDDAKSIVNAINGYLFINTGNYNTSKDLKISDLRIVPFGVNKNSYFSIINRYDINQNIKNTDNDNILLAYSHYEEYLTKFNSLNELKAIYINLVFYLWILELKTENAKSAFELFQDLNSLGKPLTQYELINSYICMQLFNFIQSDTSLNEDQQSSLYHQIYRKHWQSLESNLASLPNKPKSHNVYFQTFLKNYIFLKHIDESNISENQIYEAVRKISFKNIDKIIEWLEDMYKYSNYFKKIIDPKRNLDSELEKLLINRLSAYSLLNVTITYPLLLDMFDHYYNGTIKQKDFVDCLKLIEVFLLRKYIGASSRATLHQFFVRTAREFNYNDPVGYLKNKFEEKVSGELRTPENEELKIQMRNKDFSKNMHWAKYILCQIEKYINPAPLDLEKVQIEHIMPESLNPDWEKDLGPNWKTVHEYYKNNIGNLTLLDEVSNQRCKNYRYKDKRILEDYGYIQSSFKVTRELVAHKYEKWTEDEIKDRAKVLTDYILKIWNYNTINNIK